MSTASATPPRRSAASVSRPLSGPTSSRRSSTVRSATRARARGADRRVDDREVHARGQEAASASRSASAPARTSWRGIAWSRSITRACGQRRAITAVADAHELVLVPVVGQEADERMRPRRSSPPRGVGPTAARRSGRRCRGARPRRAAVRPCSRSVALVTGPIETIRVVGRRAASPPAAVQEEAHGRGGGERDVVGRAGAGRERARRERLGDGLVQREHVDLGAARAQRVGQHVARLARARDQRALRPGTLARAPRRAPRPRSAPARRRRAMPCAGQRPRGARADRRHRRAGQRARVARRPRARRSNSSCTPLGLVRQTRS